MTGTKSRDVFSRTARGLLVIRAILTLAASPRSTSAQQKASAKPQEKKVEAKPQPAQTRADDRAKFDFCRFSSRSAKGALFSRL